MKRNWICFVGMIAAVFIPLSMRAQSDVDKDKKTLMQLQQALRDRDAQQRKEIEAHSKDELQKGEFETTAEFDKRTHAKEDADWGEQRSLWLQQGQIRQAAYARMNAILSAEYSKQVTLEIGTYDADRQVFPISFNGEFLKVISVVRQNAKEFKELFRNVFAAAKIGLRLNENDDAEEYLVKAEITVSGSRFQFERNPLEISQAMTMMFGNYDSSNKKSAWRLDVVNEADDYKTYVTRTVYARLLAVLDYNENGTAKHVVITKNTSK